MGMYNDVILLMIFVGVILVAVEITKGSCVCPPTKVIYRFIPRTLEEEQQSPVGVSKIYSKMFAEPSPWLLTYPSINKEVSNVTQ